MWGGWGWGPGWGFGWVFGVLLIVWLFRVVFYGRPWGWRHDRRWGWGGPYGPGGYGPGYGDAEEMLRGRLARGEIDEAEYQRLLDILRR